MKALAILSSLMVVGIGFAIIKAEPIDLKNENTDQILISCMTFPWCGGVEPQNPIVQPKDSKTETQDAKDEKVA